MSTTPSRIGVSHFRAVPFGEPLDLHIGEIAEGAAVVEEKLHFPVHVRLQGEFPRKLPIISRFALRSMLSHLIDHAYFFVYATFAPSNLLVLVFGISGRSVITLTFAIFMISNAATDLSLTPIFARDASRALGLLFEAARLRWRFFWHASSFSKGKLRRGFVRDRLATYNAQHALTDAPEV